MAITTAKIEAALGRSLPAVEYDRDALALQGERAHGELDAWAHAGHEVSVERVIPFIGDPGLLRWVFWCESCQISQLALLSRPAAE